MIKLHQNKIRLRHIKAKYGLSVRDIARLINAKKSLVHCWLSFRHPQLGPSTAEIIGIVVLLANRQKKIERYLAITDLENKIKDMHDKLGK